MKMTSDSRVWFITGTSSGFGRAIAEAALADGDVVVATARDPRTVDDLVAAYPGRVTALALDVTDVGRAGAALDEAIAAYGYIDVLVNSAGRVHIGAVEETTDADLRDLMEVHFFAPIALTRAVLPGMRERGTGTIVQISSMSGRVPFPAVGAYAASKAALEAMSEALAGEVGQFGIKVLLVEPGAFRTKLAAGSATVSAPVAAYDPMVGPFREGFPAVDGKQPGDPAKAAAAILDAVKADKPPLRLALGKDAADMALAYLDNTRAELVAYDAVARGTDYS
jgi:NAD(P)-dependent dehydrogenase (short-subunit alcohol dehydrogenase family)